MVPGTTGIDTPTRSSVFVTVRVLWVLINHFAESAVVRRTDAHTGRWTICYVFDCNVHGMICVQHTIVNIYRLEEAAMFRSETL